MTAVIKILGWESEGLRCPDHEVNCCHENGTPYAVSLIQMPNGTGKTTTLTLLRAALSGVLPEDVHAFKKRDFDSNYGSFSLRLLLNELRVTIVMRFDFQRGSVQFKTTRGSGQVEGFDPPAEFKRFLSAEFVNFFVFDGELAQHLLDRRQVHAESVIETLFQINSLRMVADDIRDYWDSKTDRNGATEDKALTRRKNKVAALRERLGQLERAKKHALQLREDLGAEIAKKQQEYQSEIGKEESRDRELTEAQARLDDAAARVDELAADVLDCMRDPQALSSVFARELRDLKVGLDRVKLPEEAAREFFEELAGEDFCICGRPINEHVSVVIRERAQQYLGSDDVSLLNSLKSAIQEAIGDSVDSASNKLSRDNSELGRLVAERQSARTRLKNLRDQASDADPKVKDAAESIVDLERRLQSITEILQQYDDKDESKRDEDTTGILIIKHRLEDAERKAGEIADTLILKNKRDILTKILDKAYNNARRLIIEEICADANRLISAIMPHNDILIDRVDRCLVLGGQEGASAGETLSVAYAFLATLFNRSDHQLPFVVDSPAGPIDLGARPKIGELVPRLTDQFIAFTISSEREGFVPRLKSAAKGDAMFTTIFRREAVSASYVPSDVSRSETRDGVAIIGETFFNQFQLDSEE